MSKRPRIPARGPQSAERTRKAYATLAALRLHLLPDESFIIVIKGVPTLITNDGGTPARFCDLIDRMERRA
jgi:hypothetical protein